MAEPTLFDEASLALIASGGAGKDGRVYSIKPTNGDGDFPFSRGSNLAATRVGPDGLIEKGRENLLLQSNQFDTTWANSGAAETGGQADKDGGSTAWLLEKSVSDGYIYQYIAQGGVQTFSVYAKAGTSTWLRLVANTSNFQGGYFDLSNGVTGNVENAIDTEIEDIGSGWYRCSVILNGSTSRVRIYPAEANSQSATSGSIYIQDSQLEIGLATTQYIESGASTGKAGLLENEPRFDYSGGVTCPSLLKEKPRTNKITNSEYINTTTFNFINLITIDNNHSTSPDGLNNACKIIAAASSGYHQLRTTLATANGYDMVSCFVKASGYNYVQLASWADPSNYVNFDLTDGSIGSVGSNGPSIKGIEDYGNGWYRIHANVQASGGGLIGIGIVTSASAGWAQSFTGNGTDGLLIWGVQIEVGNYPTSYIPNHSGGTITRGGETANYVTVGGGSEKWSLMYEFDFNKTPLQQNEIFSTIRSLPSNNVAITFRHFTRDSVKHVISPYFNLEPAYPFGSGSASNVTDSSVLLRANGDGSYDYFASLNGVVAKTSVTGMSNIAFNRIDLGAGASTAHKKVILFANTLSDAECVKLITI